MPTLDCGTVQLFYELSGDPSAPCVVFSNSLGTNHRMWDKQVAALENDFFVLRYDMRGHGFSSTPPGPYTIAQLGADTLSLLDKLDLAKVHFCGLSIGGAVGQWLGLHAPERLESLILSNTAAKIGTRGTWNARIRQVRDEGISAIADTIISRWFTESYRSSHPSEIQSIRSVLRSTSPQGYSASCEAIRSIDFREAIRTIEMPTLIIAGEFDSVTTVTDARQLARKIPHSRLAIIPAAHISNIEASCEFNVNLLQFLREADHDR